MSSKKKRGTNNCAVSSKARGSEVMGKKYCFVRWVDTEQYGVIGSSECRKGQAVYPGSISEFMWSDKHWYEAEVLKLSDNRQELSKLCDRLCRGEMTREEVLAASEAAVHSTTPEKLPAKKRLAKKSAQESKRAKIEAAKEKAQTLLTYPGYHTEDESEESDSEEVERLRKEVTLLQKKLEKRDEKNCVDDSGDDWYEDQPSDCSEITEQLDKYEQAPKQAPKQIKQAKKQQPEQQPKPPAKLTQKQKSPFPPKDILISAPPDRIKWTPSHAFKRCGKRLFSSEDCLISTPSERIKRTPSQSFQHSGKRPFCSERDDMENLDGGSIYDSVEGPSDSTPLSRKTQKVRSAGLEAMPSNDISSMKKSPKLVEVVEGYGIVCTKPQLDEAISSASTPTKLARNLLGIFYSPEELSKKTACGKRGKFEAIDSNVLLTIVCCVQKHYSSTSKTVIIDAINDKCANYRRRKQT